MNRSVQIKLAIIVVAILWSVYSLWPTFRLAEGTDGLDAAKIESLQSRAIKRGLDLEGGMYLVLQVDKTQIEGDTLEDAVNRTIEVLRNRVDEFGVSEPVIQKEGGARIVVQLPGLQDVERAKRLIGSTARLDFRLVRSGNSVRNVVARIDQALEGESVVDSTQTDSAQTDSTRAEAGVDSTTTGDLADSAADSAQDDLFADVPPEDTGAGRSLSGLIGPYWDQVGGFPVSMANEKKVEKLLNDPVVQRVMPRDAEFLWGVEPLTLRGGAKAKVLYLVDKDVSLAGTEISKAVVTPDPDRPPKLMVSLTLTRRGGLRFANVTGENVGRKLAIVLDGKVRSAPNINSRIPGGRASISGGFDNDQEARDLAVMLRAGALPADVTIAEERTVGPSLGAESIREGVRSVVFGGALVIVFLLLYYRAAGALATAGLIVTLLTLMAILAQLHLTLTLPGLAGIILTVGMAVDANVLIFERIREEMRRGKSPRAAIDVGYGQATRAIVDANITTFIAAVILFYFGTGPIKGFAVTLSVGILTSMFSALVFTRTVYDLWLNGRQPKSLSI
jgi:protein-export membrane protein SecD